MGTHTRGPFWMKIALPAAETWGAPARAPKRPTPITAGVSTCMTLTPRLPSPPLSPRAVPASRLGQKGGTLAMDDAKLPPPIPAKAARTTKVEKGVAVSWRARPAPRAGRISRAVVTAMVLRPPAMPTMNVAGIRRVAPASPAMLIRVKSCESLNGKPASFMRTARMLQNIHTAKALRSAGMEISRLRHATREPPSAHAEASSGFQVLRVPIRIPCRCGGP